MHFHSAAEILLSACCDHRSILALLAHFQYGKSDIDLFKQVQRWSDHILKSMNLVYGSWYFRRYRSYGGFSFRGRKSRVVVESSVWGGRDGEFCFGLITFSITRPKWLFFVGMDGTDSMYIASILRITSIGNRRNKTFFVCFLYPLPSFNSVCLFFLTSKEPSNLPLS